MRHINKLSSATAIGDPGIERASVNNGQGRVCRLDSRRSLPFAKTEGGNDSYFKDLCWLTLLIGLAYLLTLGIPPLFTPDEARYAEIPREMLAHHNFVIPTLDEVFYFEKPPFLYWLIAFFESHFGFSEWSVRLPNALLSIATCSSVYVFGRMLFNRRTGIFAALILSSSLLFFGVGRLLTTDATLSFTLTLCLLCFLGGLVKNNRGLLWLSYVFAALAVLTKGLIGIVFPGGIVFLFVLLMNDWQILKRIYLLSGLILIFVIALPWHLLAQHENSHFLYQYIYVQHIERFLTPIMSRQMSKPVYVAAALASFMPWTCFLFQAVKQQWPVSWAMRKHYQVELFLMLWPAFIFAFFALSDSVLVTYFMPLLAPLALLVARYFDKIGESKSKHFHHFFYGLIAGVWLIGNVIWVAFPHFHPRSIKPLAPLITSTLTAYPTAEVVSYSPYIQDLPYYLQQRVDIVFGWEGELLDGLNIEPEAHQWILTNDEFTKRLQHQPMLVVVTDEDVHLLQDGAHPLYCLAKKKPFVLLTNIKGVRPQCETGVSGQALGLPGS